MRIYQFIILIFISVHIIFAQDTSNNQVNTGVDEQTKTKISEMENTLKKQQEDLEELKRLYGDKQTAKSASSGYVSPMKKDGISPDYLRSLFIEPEMQKALSKDQSMWLNDTIRVGFQVRPRSESRTNTDFNKNTDDYINRQSLGTQVWFLIDPHPNVTAKVTIQDSRILGGSSAAPVGDERRYLFDASGTTINPQTYSQSTNPACTSGTALTPGNFNSCMTPSQSNSNTVPNNTGIREAFVDLKNLLGPVRIRLGRQIIAYGDQRMLGGANWLQNGLSYDGVKLATDNSKFSADVFAMKMTAGQNYQGQQEGPNGLLTTNGRKNGSIDDSYLVGTYNTIKLPDFNIDLYGIGILKKWVPSTTSTYSLPNAVVYPSDRSKQADDLLTAGFRITNRTAGNALPKEKNWDWTLESAWQGGLSGQTVGATWDPLQQQNINSARNPYITETTGSIYNIQGTGQCGGVTCTGNGNTNLYTERVKYAGQMHLFQTGYTFFQRMRVGVGYNFASGNSNRNSGSNSTFQTLPGPRFGTFPIWNTINGISETIDSKNLKSYSTSLSYKSDDFGFFQVAYFQHKKAAMEDSWYAVSGAANNSSTVGSTEVLNNNPYVQNNNPMLPGKRLGRNLFHEIDLTWIYKWNDHVSFWSGFAYLTAGDAIKNERNNPITVDKNNNYVYNSTGNSFRKNASVAWFMVTTVF